jgi:hypothetical protein
MPNPTDPTELAKRAAMSLFKTGHALAAAIVYGEAAKLAPDDPEILCGFGAGVGNSAGRLVIAPFVQWSTRILERCVACGDTPYAKIARERLVELRSKPEYLPLPAAQPGDFEPLVAFLDVEPRNTIPAAIDALAEDDRMFAIMALGDLGSPRFWSAIAAAIEGRWGDGAARSALKRVGRYASHRAVRDAMVALRRSPLGAECDPYLEFAERNVASIPIAIEPVEGFVKVQAPPAGAVVPPPAPAGSRKPWWKFW